MKEHISHNRPPKGQASPASSSPLLHITLNTGHAVEHHDSTLHADTYALLSPLLQERGGAIPGMPGFAVAWTYRGDATMITICHSIGHFTVPVVAIGLAWGSQEALGLWGFLNSLAGPLISSSELRRSLPMPRLPWMAVVLLPSFVILAPADAKLLGSFERYLGLALLRHRGERN